MSVNFHREKNVFKLKEVNFPFNRLKLQLNKDDCSEIDLNSLILIIPSPNPGKLNHYGILAEVQSFEYLSYEKIEINLYLKDRVRVLTTEQNKYISVTIKDYLSKFENSISNILDYLSGAAKKLNQIKTVASLNLKEKFTNYFDLLKEGFYRHDIQRTHNLMYGLAYHIIKDDWNKLKFLYLSYDFKEKMLLYHIELSIQDIELEFRLQEELKERLSKQQKNYLLNEKIRLLEEQIEDFDDEKEQEGISKSQDAPEWFKKTIQKEKERLNSIQRNSPEYPQQKKLINFLISLPWKIGEEEYQEEKVRITLDETHYGLEPIKEEIIDYITLYNRSKGNYNKVLCLVGGPGLGKTSIAKSVAKALNREFKKISLAGVSDSSFLIGTSKVYVHSQPGSIINNMSKLNRRDPLILLDEIDKTINRGSLNSGTAVEYSLLDILDSENNKDFKDHFLDESYPLDKVLFIVTANSIQDIPLPLKNRLTVISVSPYTVKEKLIIAKKWLLPSILKYIDLSGKIIKIDDNLILTLIQRFTWESGVRILKQKLEKLVVASLRNRIDLEKEIDENILEKIFGWNRIFYDTGESSALPLPFSGRSIGLWASGDLLFGGIIVIDAFSYNLENKEEKINFPQVTGSVGNMIKESSQQAYLAIINLFRKKKKNEILKELISRKWLIHYGTAGSSKEGPSAGLATAVAILSEIIGSPSNSIAMTGEINLRGEVLAIGGVERKLFGALRHSVKSIILPEANKVDVDKIKSESISGLKINFVKNLEEVVKIIWGNYSFIQVFEGRKINDGEKISKTN